MNAPKRAAGGAYPGSVQGAAAAADPGTHDAGGQSPGRSAAAPPRRFRHRGYGAVGRLVHKLRTGDGARESGLDRLTDLHAASCAGDALIAIGLAGTIFFSVPVGEARTRVALYLLITMAPFALLAPVIGPVLDRFRHGRRYALAVTMLGRAFLAFAIADHLNDWALYPAAFGVLALSRAYGVARSAAVPRLRPLGLTLVEANARGSLAGTVAAGVVAPIGLAAALAGSQWTLRVAGVMFLLAMVLALRLPPKADSEPPEQLPRMMSLGLANSRRALTGTRVWCALTASGAQRTAYGFLTLFFAFRTREDHFGVPPTVALGIIAGGLAVGSFIATAASTRMKLRHPLALQLGVVVATMAFAGLAALSYNIVTATLLTLVAAVGSGLAKFCVDAVIQRNLPEQLRASAFSQSETLLQLAWVAGGALGLLPVTGSLGLSILALVLGLAAIRVLFWVRTLRRLPAPPYSDDDALGEAGTSSRGEEDDRTEVLPLHTTGTSSAMTEALPRRAGEEDVRTELLAHREGMGDSPLVDSPMVDSSPAASQPGTEEPNRIASSDETTRIELDAAHGPQWPVSFATEPEQWPAPFAAQEQWPAPFVRDDPSAAGDDAGRGAGQGEAADENAEQDSPAEETDPAMITRAQPGLWPAPDHSGGRQPRR